MRQPVFHLCLAVLLVVALAVVATAAHPATLGSAMVIAAPTATLLAVAERRAPAASRLVFAAPPPFRGPPAHGNPSLETQWTTTREVRWHNGTGWPRS